MILLSALALATVAVAAQDAVLPRCDIANLPDPSLINSDGKLHIRTSKPVESDGDMTFYLAEALDCGAMIRLRPKSREDRTALLDRLPTVAAKLVVADAEALKLVRETNRNGFPLEIWNAGSERFFLVIAQQMDAKPEYDPMRGTVCVGFTRLPLMLFSPLQLMNERSLDWADAMERLATACMAGTPEDSASNGVIAAANEVNAAMDRAAQGEPVADNIDIALQKRLDAAQLTPRPASWPERKPADVEQYIYGPAKRAWSLPAWVAEGCPNRLS